MAKVTNRKKGDVLENVVAWLHELGATSVKTRVKIDALDADYQREIDVLVTQDVAEYPVRLSIECKNEKDRIGIGRIDEFIGKLDDIGIPPFHGIFVTPIGYTRAARSRAKKKGIVLLTLDGLDSTQLAEALNAALLNIVHYVLFVELSAFFPYLPEWTRSDAFSRELPDVSELGVFNHLWSEWVTSSEPVSLGVTTKFFREPGGVSQVSASLRVVAYVGQVRGTAKHVTLTNALSQRIERGRIAADFDMPTSLAMHAATTDEELSALMQAGGDVAHVVRHRVRLPRIVAANVFWPPTAEAIQKVIDMRERGERVTFDAVEGQDLSRAWMR
jgi:hypothetical protein